MYDILQLNDMLVPELLDIAEQLKIPNAKKLNKQDLVYKILDSQAITASEKKGDENENKRKRKRIIKASTSLATEEAYVEENDNDMTKSTRNSGPGKSPARKNEKPAAKRSKKKPDEDGTEEIPEEEIITEEASEEQETESK